MGKSPKEKRADQMYDTADARTAERNQQAAAWRQDIQGQTEKDIAGAQQALGKASTARAQGMGLQLGDMLASQGIAGGHDTAGAWVAQMSPIFAQEQQSLAQLMGQKMGLNQATGQSFLQMLQNNWQGNDQVKLGALGATKDSTVVGDVMSTVTPIAQLIASLYGMPTMPGLSNEDVAQGVSLYGKPKKITSNSMEWGSL